MRQIISLCISLSTCLGIFFFPLSNQFISKRNVLSNYVNRKSITNCILKSQELKEDDLCAGHEAYQEIENLLLDDNCYTILLFISITGIGIYFIRKK